MKKFGANSLCGLLWQVILTTYLWNLLFTFVIYAPTLFASKKYDEYILFRFIVYIVISMLSILWGLCFRRVNTYVLSSAIRKRKKYATCISIMLVIMLSILLVPDLPPDTIAVGFSYINSFVSKLGPSFVMHLVIQACAMPTIVSVLLALAAVFLYQPNSLTVHS